MPGPSQLKNSADLLLVAGRGDKAIKPYRQAHDLFLEDSDVLSAIECQHMLGLSYVSEGRQKEGLKNLNIALQAQEKQGLATNTAITLRSLGEAHMLYKKYFESYRLFNESLDIFLDTNNHQEISLTRAKLARLYSLTGEESIAQAYLKESGQDLNSPFSDSHLVAIHSDRAAAQLELDQLTEASKSIDMTKQILEESGQSQSHLRRFTQVMGLELHLLCAKKSWLEAWRLYQLRFVEVHQLLSPGCRAVLNLEIDTSSLVKNFSYR
jgi:tetratricopeptide (TPR) repeat protein